MPGRWDKTLLQPSHALPSSGGTPMPISPNQGSTGGGTTVTITGVNLANATAVKFGSKLATITANTPTSVTVGSPSGAACGRRHRDHSGRHQQPAVVLLHRRPVQERAGRHLRAHRGREHSHHQRYRADHRIYRQLRGQRRHPDRDLRQPAQRHRPDRGRARNGQRERHHSRMAPTTACPTPTWTRPQSPRCPPTPDRTTAAPQ